MSRVLIPSFPVKIKSACFPDLICFTEAACVFFFSAKNEITEIQTLGVLLSNILSIFFNVTVMLITGFKSVKMSIYGVMDKCVKMSTYGVMDMCVKMSIYGVMDMCVKMSIYGVMDKCVKMSIYGVMDICIKISIHRVRVN